MHPDPAAEAEAAVYPDDPLLAADQMRRAISRLREDLSMLTPEGVSVSIDSA